MIAVGSRLSLARRDRSIRVELEGLARWIDANDLIHGPFSELLRLRNSIESAGFFVSLTDNA